MKEFSIEEKARAYDKALERAQALYNDKNEIGYANAESVLEEVFPLLKESEDELTWLTKYIEEEAYSLSMDIRGNEDRIKLKNLQKALAWLEKQGEMDMKSYKAAEDEKREFVGDGFIKCYADFQDFKEGETYWLEYVGNDNYNVRSDNLLGKTYHITPCQLYTIFKKMTWLEKQGEKKPADKAEPKFNVGDWILYSGDYYEGVRHITKINENGYYIERNGLPHGIIPFNHEICMRLWSTQDAKDGDVLAEDTCIFIIKKLNPNHTAEIYCCLHDDGDFELNSNLYFDNTCTYPATKEQRNLLFQKMKEAGYEWDAEKKELKLFITNGGDFFESENCEQKHTDKVEPKFKVGDWIVFNGLTLYINEVVQGYYRTISIGGIPNSYDWDIDNVARLWAIQDAKDGDVLACENGWTCIFKCLNDNLFSSHCFMDHEGWFCEDGGQGHTLDNRICGEIYPATNEQRDTLMKAMADAGYTFDFDKRELKKIEQKPAILDIDKMVYVYANNNEPGNQEFGKPIKCMIRAYRQGLNDAIEKVASFSPWNEDDEDLLYKVTAVINRLCAEGKEYVWSVKTLKKLFYWLKSLKDRVQPQPKQEWSEEDEKNLNDVILFIKTGTYSLDKEKLIDWVKSFRPQSHWKPSDEQLEALKDAIRIKPFENPSNNLLWELYEQLKKLIGG